MPFSRLPQRKRPFTKPVTHHHFNEVVLSTVLDLLDQLVKSGGTGGNSNADLGGISRSFKGLVNQFCIVTEYQSTRTSVPSTSTTASRTPSVPEMVKVIHVATTDE